jgi:hypothetical protein
MRKPTTLGEILEYFAKKLCSEAVPFGSMPDDEINLSKAKQELLDLLESKAVYAKVKSGNGELEYVIPLTALKELGDK